MSTKLLAAIIFAILIPSAGVAFNFTSLNGTNWQADIPPGWHRIDTDEGLKEGIHFRLVTSPSGDWQNPWPPKGEAFVIVNLTMKKGATLNNVVSKRKPQEFKSVAAQIAIGKRQATKYDMDTYGVAESSQLLVVQVDDYLALITVYDNGYPKLQADLIAIVESLKVMP